MQEEVENRAVNLAVSTSRLTGRAMVQGINTYLRYRKNKQLGKPDKAVGKQRVKELIGQGAGVTSIDVADGSIRTFCRIAKKHGVDYAIKKEKGEDKSRYVVFFKARDQDALESILRDYQKKVLKDKGRESVLTKLKALKKQITKMPEKIRIKSREMER